MRQYDNECNYLKVQKVLNDRIQTLQHINKKQNKMQVKIASCAMLRLHLTSAKSCSCDILHNYINTRSFGVPEAPHKNTTHFITNKIRLKHSYVEIVC